MTDWRRLKTILIEKERKMEKFHITIKDNETGEIRVDTDTCAIRIV